MKAVKITRFRLLNDLLHVAIRELGKPFGGFIKAPSCGCKKVEAAFKTAFYLHFLEATGVGKGYRGIEFVDWANDYLYDKQQDLVYWDGIWVYGLKGHSVSPSKDWIRFVREVFNPFVTDKLKMATVESYGIYPYIIVGEWMEKEYNELEALGYF
jgi:hypothetical protein